MMPKYKLPQRLIVYTIFIIKENRELNKGLK